jgi:beta-N-acetylhexosaminidase
MNTLMSVYDSDRKQALSLADTCGWLMAVELRAVGIDFSFAPVLDLDLGISDVIVDRAFHSDPEAVGELACAYTKGMSRAGMAATGKHFPGHGAVKVDSHIDFPVDQRELESIYMQDVKPFEHLIKNGLAGIMPAHVIYSKVDPQPAGFSSFWLGQVLRERLQFQGAIFSDDLSMKAASVVGDVVDRANAAIKAGCDMALVCNDPESAVTVLDKLAEHNDPVSHVRLARMHGRHFVNRKRMLKDPEWHKAVNAIQVLR